VVFSLCTWPAAATGPAFAPPQGAVRFGRTPLHRRFEAPMQRGPRLGPTDLYTSPGPLRSPDHSLGRSARSRLSQFQLTGSGSCETDRQRESVVLLVGADAQDEKNVQEALQAAGAGSPLGDARLVQATDLSCTLDDVLREPPASGRCDSAQTAGSMILFLFGSAAIDEDGQQAFLEHMDEKDESILLVPAVRNPDVVLVDLVASALAEHDASYQLGVPVETHDECSWDPATSQVTMNLELDGAVVETRSHGALRSERWDTGNVAVLDNFFGEDEREALLAELVPQGFDLSESPPETHWERSLSDIPGLPRTLGLRPNVLQNLCEARCKAILEIQSRIALLYPDYHVCRMPEAVLGEVR